MAHFLGRHCELASIFPYLLHSSALSRTMFSFHSVTDIHLVVLFLLEGKLTLFLLSTNVNVKFEVIRVKHRVKFEG